MGRYIYSDNEELNGYKFAFGIQSSNAPERFGAIDNSSSFINYTIEEKEPIVEEINKIKKNLGENILLFLNDFFKKNDFYNDKILIDEAKKNNINIDEHNVRNILNDFFDLVLGEKLLKAFESNYGEPLEFQSEL